MTTRTSSIIGITITLARILNDSMEEQSLLNFIKYCLGYVKITRERTIAAQQKYSVELPKNYFGLLGLLNGDQDGNLGEPINLENFYSYDPRDVPDVKREDYEKEKELAQKIDEIYSKYKNDQFTKQTIFSFGYFEVELPIEINGDEIEVEEEKPQQLQLGGENSESVKVKTKVDRFPLFSLPVRIEKVISKGVGKYYVYFVDAEIQVNIGMLEPILGEDLYFQLLEEMGKYEIDGRLTLPTNDLQIFQEVWHKIKAQLRLKEANFDESSFSLDEAKISLGPKANYFLAEDLAKLAQLSEEELSKTALTSWTENDELNNEGDTPQETDLYFPFLYDKFQLSTLSIIGNKASIIQGPPGTGKSETISNILCHLAASGKRVLFVSQKAQALKVVKDKLKKTGVKYLYGYLPNPGSAQLGEEDESDGIAPQLSALGSHIEKLGYRFNLRGRLVEQGDLLTRSPRIDEVVEKRDALREALNRGVENQRRFYQLHQELTELNKYDLEITDFSCFKKNFSSVEWQKIIEIKNEIEVLSKHKKNYERSGSKKELDELFSTFDLSKRSFSVKIGEIRDDVIKTGYDRHSVLIRKLNNTFRNVRLSKIRGRLPREVIDYINNILAKDLSRNDAVKHLSFLYDHCYYYENVSRLGNYKNEFLEKLNSCGISDKEFATVSQRINGSPASDLDEVKQKILRVQEIKKELSEISKENSVNQTGSDLKRTENERSRRVATYIQNIVNTSIIEKWRTGITIKQIVRKLASAFGKSKKAFKTFDTLRKDVNNFNAILDLIPVWIMELDDASRIIPLEPGIFDYVVLDEASQCNVAYTLPIMYRTNRVLFVGDSEQMRDSTIMFKSNRIFDELARRYQIPEERQIKATGSAVQSVLDIAYKRGFMAKPLHYHYRSPAELIGFSNDYFYKPKGKELIPVNSNYLTYGDSNRVMVIHEVKSDWKDEFSDNVNVAEAKKILELFKELRADERYRDKSIGILSFFNAQATYIRGLFEKEGLREDSDNYKVSIIEGIQGDEKDIIIYSFVIRSLDQKNRYYPLTGEGGDIRADVNKGRVNVAFSRARLQVHCIISMPVEEIPEKIWIKKYLQYVMDNGEVSFYSTELKSFDSYFEEEFFSLLKSRLRKGYKIQNQVESCGFKIDFVVSSATTGKRIAVECDGPCHFKDEIDEAYGIHIESDEERQRVLEAAGWKFCRIKYSDWINDKFDRNVVVKTISELLC